ncbi:NAD(P)-binding protein [Athelia psychrophila]|uniref:NAD(P)-binding protein n=2 Tax=Athelia psychrophila TaxID=1759441 RepID=A0A166TXC8_9AGAM|nr:NAD(P)-binding protein [Fibularhizoctonia sp. CBS 109695]
MSTTSDLTGKVIVVFGATGAQGGSVAKYLLQDGKAKVRAITRKADSEAAKALAKAGAEIVVANQDDPASLDSAFAGAHGVYGVTNFWEHYFGEFAAVSDEVAKAQKSQDRETVQGKNIVDAAKRAGIKHFVWSTLWHTDVPEDKTPHFEGKHDIDNYAKAQGVPLTSLYTAFYFENLANVGMLGKNADGTFTVQVAFPEDLKLPSYSVGETGGWVTEAFKNPSKWIGKDIHALGESISVKEFASTLAAISGKQVGYNKVSKEEFLAEDGVKKNPHVGLEMWLNLKNFYDHQPGPTALYDAKLSESVFPGASNFAAFAKKDAALKKILGY